MAEMSTTAKKDAVKGVFTPTTTYYLSLASATPGTAGTHEITGITRKGFKFGTPTATGKQKSKTAVTLTMPSKSKAGFVMVFTAVTAGTYLWGGSSGLGTTTIPSGATVKFAAGTVSAHIT